MTPRQKILSRDQALLFVQEQRVKGKRVGFTSGTFDLLHAGHVSYLAEARNHCDVLVVAVNSDASVRSYKGPGRPVTGEFDRALVVAALESVSAVFIFEETNNNENIRILRPDVYIKASDYSAENLSSRSLVEGYGGHVLLLPMVEGRSTTSIIERLGGDGGKVVSEVLHRPAPGAFIDRDGTMIEHVEYLHEPGKVKVLPGVWDGLKRLKQAGYRLIMTTNQPGIGLGYFTREDFFVVNREVLKQASAEKVYFDRIYFCPHHEGEKCRCRKPEVLMVERARKELNLLVADSVVIGDSAADVLLAKNAGCRSVLLGAGRTNTALAEQAGFVAPDFGGAVDWILRS